METSRLFARLYLDENVDALVAPLVRGQGFEVTTARDEKMLGQSDPEQLAFAAKRSLVLVTHDRTDFEALARAYFEENRTHWGIIISPDRPLRALVRRLVALLDEQTAEDLRNQLVYI